MLESRPTTHTYEDYLNTPDDERWELLNGSLTRRPTPNTAHQRTLGNLAIALFNFVDATGIGEAIISPYDVVLSYTNVLEPDLIFVASDQKSIITEANIQGAPTLLIEVVSPSTLTRDREVKRSIYAEHGVGEYWLVDPDARTISVLTLHGKEFRQSAHYTAADTLSSPTLPALALDLTSIFPPA